MAGVAAGIQIPISGSDVKELLGDDIKIITYESLSDITHIDDLFDARGRCMLLYLVHSSTSGHWCCLIRNGNDVEFFDPYGGVVDSELKWVPAGLRHELHEDTPVLRTLLASSGVRLTCNQFAFQSPKPEVATCGRHCCLRLASMHTPLGVYGPAVLRRAAPDRYADAYAVEATLPIIGK